MQLSNRLQSLFGLSGKQKKNLKSTALFPGDIMDGAATE